MDGLCLSCRAALADGLYRVEWVEPQPGVVHGRHGLPDKRYRILVVAPASEHPLGWEINHPIDPILYLPETVREAWRLHDRRLADLKAAEQAARTLEEWG